MTTSTVVVVEAAAALRVLLLHGPKSKFSPKRMFGIQRQQRVQFNINDADDDGDDNMRHDNFKTFISLVFCFYLFFLFIISSRYKSNQQQQY